MIRTKLGVWSLASFFLMAAPGLLRADLDKEAKEKKDAKAAKAGMDSDDHEKYHERLAEEGEKTLEEINKLLEQVQKDLGGQKTGEATQARQKEVVDRIEKLIKQLDKG